MCQPLSSPGYAAAPQQTPDGKGGRNKSRLLGWGSPSVSPRQPTSGSSFSKCRNFSQGLNPVPTATVGVVPPTSRRRPTLGAAPDSAAAVRSSLSPSSPFPLSRWLSAPLSWGREVGKRESGDRERGLGGSADSRAPGKCLNNRTDAAALVSLGCGKVGCCCNWSCWLGLPGAQRSRTKTQPAPLEPAASPRTLPFLLSAPALPGKLGSSRLRPGATALPSLAAAAFF